MKKIIWAIVLIVIIIVIGWCLVGKMRGDVNLTSAVSQTLFRNKNLTYKNSDWIIQMNLPASWSGYKVSKLENPAVGSYLCFSIPKKGSFSPCLIQLYRLSSINQPTVGKGPTSELFMRLTNNAGNATYYKFETGYPECNVQLNSFQKARCLETPGVAASLKVLQ